MNNERVKCGAGAINIPDRLTHISGAEKRCPLMNFYKSCQPLAQTDFLLSQSGPLCVCRSQSQSQHRPSARIEGRNDDHYVDAVD